LNALVDFESIFAKAMAGFQVSDADRRGMLDGLRKSMIAGQGLPFQLIKNSQDGGELAFLRTRRSHQRPAVLFRMTQPPSVGTVGYLEFLPERCPDGKIRAGDVYNLSSAELLSESIHRFILPFIASRSRTFLDKFLTGEGDVVRDLPKIRQLNDAVNQG